MNTKLVVGVLLILCATLTEPTTTVAQQPAAPGSLPASSIVPNLINYTSILKDSTGRTLSSLTGVTFLLYKDDQGGAPLWVETQNVTPDKFGRYTVQLGAASKNGIPPDLFLNGEARWLALQIANEPEQARTLLVAVPYAMKSLDAQTLGGLPPSAFMLAAPPTSSNAPAAASSNSVATESTALASPNVTTSGNVKAGTIPLFKTATDIEGSIVTQTGTTTINVGGTLNLPATGTATTLKSFSSQPQRFVASVNNGSLAVPQTFQWQAEGVNNGKPTATGTLNFLSAAGSATPTETGLRLNNKGQFTFVPGQTYPGAGTLTSVGLSAPTSDFSVTGSPVTHSGLLNLSWKVAPTSVDTANAIVKRDSTGSFKVTSISGSGTFSTLTANSTAIQGSTSFSGGIGVHGSATAASGVNAGVLGDVVSTKFLSSGVIGNDGNTSGSGGVTLGVQGHSQNPFGIGVLGFNGINGLSQRFQVTAGSQRIGVWGDAEGGSTELEAIGVVGKSDTGVGVFAENGPGGCCAAIVALGGTSANALGATGLPGIASNAGNGDPNNIDNGGDGVIATGGNGGRCDSSVSPNNCGTGGAGISATGGFGVFDTSFVVGGPGAGGVFTGGASSSCLSGCGGAGIVAIGGMGTENTLINATAGDFRGNLLVSEDLVVQGQILAGVKDFKIDHPLDPANKYLVHASVESSEMKTIYDGFVTTDARGEATVKLPEWFEVLNRDFRYQLTVIGQFAQAIVGREIQNHEFTIRTNAPNVKVSWQVTGVRQDAFAKAHPLVVEEEKEARLKGFYIHPELYGAPEEKQIEWARHPQIMKKIKETRARQVAAMKKSPTSLAQGRNKALTPKLK